MENTIFVNGVNFYSFPLSKSPKNWHKNQSKLVRVETDQADL